jgi:transcription elongation GreA/GreB family factor
MSRAFVKDHDDDAEPPIQRPVSNAPNYVTPHGLELLKAALADAEKAGNDRERRYYAGRVSSAIVLDPAAKPHGAITFGATVVARDARGNPLRVRIVGEDEADPLHGTISWESPIAQAFADHAVGDTVRVARPAGPIEYRIESVSYE